MLNESLILTVKDSNNYNITVSGQDLQGKVGEVLRNQTMGFALLVDLINGASGQRFIVEKRSLSKTLKDLRQSISASEKGRKSSILRLTAKHRNPDQATKILDEVTRVYLLQNLERNAAEAARSLE